MVSSMSSHHDLLNNTPTHLPLPRNDLTDHDESVPFDRDAFNSFFSLGNTLTSRKDRKSMRRLFVEEKDEEEAQGKEEAGQGKRKGKEQQRRVLGGLEIHRLGENLILKPKEGPLAKDLDLVSYLDTILDETNRKSLTLLDQTPNENLSSGLSFSNLFNNRKRMHSSSSFSNRSWSSRNMSPHRNGKENSPSTPSSSSNLSMLSSQTPSSTHTVEYLSSLKKIFAEVGLNDSLTSTKRQIKLEPTEDKTEQTPNPKNSNSSLVIDLWTNIDGQEIDAIKLPSGSPASARRANTDDIDFSSQQLLDAAQHFTRRNVSKKLPTPPLSLSILTNPLSSLFTPKPNLHVSQNQNENEGLVTPRPEQPLPVAFEALGEEASEEWSGVHIRFLGQTHFRVVPRSRNLGAFTPRPRCNSPLSSTGSASSTLTTPSQDSRISSSRSWQRKLNFELDDPTEIRSYISASRGGKRFIQDEILDSSEPEPTNVRSLKSPRVPGSSEPRKWCGFHYRFGVLDCNNLAKLDQKDKEGKI